MITWGFLKLPMQPQTPGCLWPLLCFLLWRRRRFIFLAIRAECSVCKITQRTRDMYAAAEGAPKIPV